MPRLRILVCCVALAAAVAAAYANHFENGFHFDDFNTIVDNVYIHNLGNVPRFFTDSTTFSTVRDHQTYRPVTSASLALDYRLAGGAKPFWFHLSTFLWFELHVLLLFFLFRRIMDAADPHPSNMWTALAAAACYGLHPANAETVNYINQRADLFCTLGTAASLLWFIARPADRKRGWYLLPAIAGFFAKPPVLIFPFVLVYVFLFEEGGSFALRGWRENRARWAAALRATVPALVATVLAAALAVKMTPRGFDFAESPWLYRLTQPWVMLHYFKTFFLPTELTADSDLGVINPLGTEALAGYIFVLALAWLAVRASRARPSRPVAFGIVWFFVALLPTSLIPLGEVTNDHRMIFPFVGLALAVFWQLRLLLFRRTERLAAARNWQRTAVAGLAIVLVAAAAGTRQRNRVWRTDESLWRDVTLKSPRNGRGLMNYGLTFMKRGDYATALNYFQRAMPYTPNYWTLEVNLGVAAGALGRAAEAEAHFQRAIALAPQRPEPDVFYARWLRDTGRPRECALQLETALRKNPRFFEARDLLLEVRAAAGDRPAAERLARETLTLFPGDQTARRILSLDAAEPSDGLATPETLLQLSHRLFSERKYQECIVAARRALALKPDYADAFNNLAAAYNALGMWDDGIHAAMEAVRLSPDNQLAKNNLLWGMAQKQRAAAGK